MVFLLYVIYFKPKKSYKNIVTVIDVPVMLDHLTVYFDIGWNICSPTYVFCWQEVHFFFAGIREGFMLLRGTYDLQQVRKQI